MKIFVELFLVILVLIVGITALVYVLEFGITSELVMYMWDELWLCVGVALLLTIAQVISVSRIPASFGQKKLSFVQERSVTLYLPPGQALKSCLASLSEIPNYRLREVNSTAGKIVAMVPASWAHLGQIITFMLTPAEGGNSTRIKVMSRPGFGAVRIDFGKNMKNVERICAFLSTQHPQEFGRV